MRQDWIEFKTVNGEYGILRPEDITSAVGDNKNTTITYDDYKLEIMEPYEQVKQKIIDAEKGNWDDVVVEHFTKEEYESIKFAVEHAGFTKEYEKPLLDKLNEILKEEE